MLLLQPTLCRSKQNRPPLLICAKMTQRMKSATLPNLKSFFSLNVSMLHRPRNDEGEILKPCQSVQLDGLQTKSSPSHKIKKVPPPRPSSTPTVKRDEQKSPRSPTIKVKQTDKNPTAELKALPVKIDKTGKTYNSAPRKPPPRPPPPKLTMSPQGKQPIIGNSDSAESNDDQDISPDTEGVYVDMEIYHSDGDKPLDVYQDIETLPHYTPLQLPPLTNDNQLGDRYTKVLRKSISFDDGIYSTIPDIHRLLPQHAAAVITLDNNEEDAYVIMSWNETKASEMIHN